MDFADAVAEAAMIPEFVDNYNRLTENNFKLPRRRSHIEAMVDKACGYSGLDEAEVAKFCKFFYEYVWSRLPDECFTDEKEPTK